MESCKLEYYLPTTGFRNKEPIPAIKFRFHTMNAFYRFKHGLEKKFPPPTQEEVQRGVYRNEIMLCEHRIPQEIKFANYYNIKYCGWIKLSAGNYNL